MDHVPCLLSPTARQYFWPGGAGCSCNDWAEGLYTPADFESGDRAALTRSIRSFAEQYRYVKDEALDAVSEVARFRERH